jgi:ribosomal protein L37E
MMATSEHLADGHTGSIEGVTESLPTTPNGQDLNENALVCPRCGNEAEGHAYCSSCGFRLAAEKELPTRAAYKAAADSAPAKAAIAASRPVQAPVDATPRDRGVSRTLVSIIALVAVIALGVGVVGFLANRPKSNAPVNTQIRHLQAQLTAANHQIAAEQATISAVKAGSQAGTVSSLQSQVQKFQVCVPELQQEINGLNINTSSQSGWLTSAFLQNPTIVSSNCNKTLNGG